MPLHDFKCSFCCRTFEELRHGGEEVLCPSCGSASQQLPVSLLADYTGQASKTVQYVTRNSPNKDSHIHKLVDGDKSFLRRQIGTQRVN